MKFLYVLLAIIGAALGEIAKFQKCPESPDSVCTVSEVRLTPCPNPKRCKMTAGTQSSISFDYTPILNGEAASRIVLGE
ncbi:unnamed protein product [Leptidea sinapis]|uniref:Uncharacterized protein n=1 Tax=Leptidea sinapis TaxID=189913 RepID=A0A5E4PRS6_9NEOP|nr:unnamed protein product [Leptidea sinapis]